MSEGYFNTIEFIHLEDVLEGRLTDEQVRLYLGEDEDNSIRIYWNKEYGQPYFCFSEKHSEFYGTVKKYSENCWVLEFSRRNPEREKETYTYFLMIPPINAKTNGIFLVFEKTGTVLVLESYENRYHWKTTRVTGRPLPGHGVWTISGEYVSATEAPVSATEAPVSG